MSRSFFLQKRPSLQIFGDFLTLALTLLQIVSAKTPLQAAKLIGTAIIRDFRILYKTSSRGKLCFAQKCILGKWLYNFTKGIGRVYNLSKNSVSCSKVCGNDCLRRSVQSGHMVAERGVKKPLSATICLMEWGVLQLPILSPNILQC